MNRAAQRTFPCTITRAAGPVGPDPVPAARADQKQIDDAIAHGRRVAAERVEREASMHFSQSLLLSQVSGLPPERLGELVRE